MTQNNQAQNSQEQSQQPAPQNSNVPQPPAGYQPVAPAPDNAPQPQQPQQSQQQQPQQVQPEQAPQYGQPQQPQQQQQQQQQTHPNGVPVFDNPFKLKYLFGDGGDGSESLSTLQRVGWLALGFFGGFFGLIAAFLFTGSMSPKRKNQAIMLVWAGFAAQALMFVFMTMFGGGAATTVSAPVSTGAESSSNAFG